VQIPRLATLARDDRPRRRRAARGSRRAGPPVPSAGQREQRRTNRQAHEGRVQYDRSGERDAEDLHEDEVPEREGAEDDDHDRRRAGDDTTGAPDAGHERFFLGRTIVSRLGDAREEEHFVVHAEAEHHAEHQ